MSIQLWCEWAWLGGDAVEAGVLIDLDEGVMTSVQTGVRVCPSIAVRRPGVTLPGFVNAHSHVFHRALRGRTQGSQGSFWTWREQMYQLAERLDPQTLHSLARATYAEMALAGITCVGEFHYVHHDAGGRRYSDVNAMGHALIAAAREAGLRLTLIDACYLDGAVGKPLQGTQLRFGDGSADAWAARAAAIEGSTDVRVGAAIHSVRAVPPPAMKEVARWADERGAVLHAHVSEQPAENAACLDAFGMTPMEVLHDAGAGGDRFTAVHAIHVTPADIAHLRGSTVCVCPTTERDLADGIAPSETLRDGGVALALGSDSHTVIDMLEEARALEHDTRLATGQRGAHSASELLLAATRSGAASLGWQELVGLAPGAPADLITIGVDTVRLAGVDQKDLLSAVVFAGTGADVTDVMVGGKAVVRDRRHVSIDVAAELDRSVREAWHER